MSTPESEIERRIDSFVKKKRQEIDLSNALDFVSISSTQLKDTITCARTDSILIKQEPSSKGHLRVRRAARNNVGPQTRRPDYLQAIDKHMSSFKLNPQPMQSPKEALLNKRIHNIETFLDMPTSNSQSMHQRLKTIEDRLLFLESISPEYKHFLNYPSSEFAKQTNELMVGEEAKSLSTLANRKTYSIAQLDAIISEYEREE